MLLPSLTGPEISAPPGTLGHRGDGHHRRQPRGAARIAVCRSARHQGGRRALRRRGDRQGRRSHPGERGRGGNGPQTSVPVLRSAEPRRALALMAARFYAAQPAAIVAVTGTSGKTSVAEFTRQIFATLGHKAASLGTIGLVKPDGSVYGALTTPDPVALHAALAELAGEGVTHLAFEASSHGLDQYRLDGVRLKAAAFTNLGRDHLDYHPDENAYLAAKLRLFTELLRPGQPAVVNADGERAAEVMAAARARGLGLFTDRQGRRAFAPRLARARRLRAAHARAPRRPRFSDMRLPLARAAIRSTMRCWPPASPSATGAGRPRADRRWQQLKGVKGRLEIVGPACAAASSSSTTRTSPRRWPPRSRRCGPSHRAASSACSAAAAIATRASGRSWAASPPSKADRRHRHRRQPAQREPGGDPRRDPGRRTRRARDRRPGRGHPRGRSPAGRRRCAAGRRQGPRDRPDRRLHGAPLLGPRRRPGRSGGDENG